jgi:transposase-like protein
MVLPDSHMPVKKKEPTPTAKLRKGQDERRQAKAAKIQRATELYQQGVMKTRIAEQLDVSFDTVGRWLKNVIVDKPDSDAEPFAKNLEDSTDAVIADAKLAARDMEQQALLEVAENQSSPADKYQAYVAASAIKMLRDNLMNVRGPRTVRELSELDQLIRRNLGLNPKGGSGGSGSLTIDVSILNNSKATNGGSASVVIDAEEADND